MSMQKRDLMTACTPSTWVPMSGEVKLHCLSEDSDEFIRVTSKIKESLNVKIDKVVRVQNPYLWGCYQLKKLEHKARGIQLREEELFHCTEDVNVDSIASDNFDWRRTTRSLYGKGVSFSPCADYANKYANWNIGCERAMILSTVLVGGEIPGNASMIIPPPFFDTSIGNRTHEGVHSKFVYVKYCDYEFYPLYVAYYTLNSDSCVRYTNHYDYDSSDYDSSDFDSDYY